MQTRHRFAQRTDLPAEARELALGAKIGDIEGVIYEEANDRSCKYQIMTIVN